MPKPKAFMVFGEMRFPSASFVGVSEPEQVEDGEWQVVLSLSQAPVEVEREVQESVLANPEVRRKHRVYTTRTVLRTVTEWEDRPSQWAFRFESYELARLDTKSLYRVAGFEEKDTPEWLGRKRNLAAEKREAVLARRGE